MIGSGPESWMAMLTEGWQDEECYLSVRGQHHSPYIGQRMPLEGEEKREYQRRWMAARREAYLSDKECVWCGATSSLEIDHIDPKEKVTHNIWSWAEPRRLAELAKCRVLCCGCHKLRTAQQARERLMYVEDGACREGHPLLEVGRYLSKYRDRIHAGCAYCHHIARAKKRGGRVKTLAEWVEFRSARV